MNALTLTPPWCWVLPTKRIETRPRYYSHRGPLLVHAGKNLAPVGGMRGLLQLVRQQPFAGILYPRLLPHLPQGIGLHRWEDGSIIVPDAQLKQAVEQLPMGQLVAVVDLVDCVHMAYFATPSYQERFGASHPLTDRERAMGDYRLGRFGLLLDNYRPLLAPIPWRGFLGLWDVPDAELPPDVLALAGVS